eukprot:scaffold2190_cov87-Skeletonema_marinoi.AAC.2
MGRQRIRACSNTSQGGSVQMNCAQCTAWLEVAVACYASCCAWKNEGVVLKVSPRPRSNREGYTKCVVLCLNHLACSQLLYYIHTHYLTDTKVLFMAMTSDPTYMESE